MIKLERIILNVSVDSIEKIIENIKKFFGEEITEEEFLKIDEYWMPNDYLKEQYKNNLGEFILEYETPYNDFIKLILKRS